jgi:D-xylose transport system substrate-binding protein
MRNGIIMLAAVGLLTTGSLAACSDGPAARTTPKIGVILPDSTTSKRWEEADRKYLKAAFEAAGVPSDIQNAEGDRGRFRSIADKMIDDGVNVLMIVNLDSVTGKAVLDKAAAAGVATVDYDRLTLNGGAQYYVSFDNRAVGNLQGKGLEKCLDEQVPRKVKPVIAELHGSPTDNNATLYRRGYDSVLEERYYSGTDRYVQGPDQPVQDWDNELAGDIFAQMLSQTRNRIDGVLAANDGLANAVIDELRKLKRNGKVPVTGQDATVQGLQHILTGDQCMTVFKDNKEEAIAAADLAVSLAKRQPKPAPTTIKDTESGYHVPAVLLQPKAIFKDNVKDVIAAGYVTKKELCTADYVQLCAQHGIR